MNNCIVARFGTAPFVSVDGRNRFFQERVDFTQGKLRFGFSAVDHVKSDRLLSSAAWDARKSRGCGLDFIAVFFGDFLLRDFDFLAEEFDDFSGFHADHVVMVHPGIEFVISLAALEIVFFNQAGGFKLVEHAVNRRQADFFVGLQQAAIDVIRRVVPVTLALQDFKNSFARMRHFQARLFEVTAFH